MINRRRFLQTVSGAASGSAVLSLSGLIPTWAQSADQGNLGIPALHGNKFDLSIGEFPVRFNGRKGKAIGVNGAIPSPLIRFREGEEITLNVKNTLKVDGSIHWHGLLVPFPMDGVPGITFPGISPGETFKYKFSVPQSGTYWYHSHSGLQEQQGHYGPIIIDPKHADPVKYDREYVLVLSDWTFQDPHRIFEKLKSMSDSFNYQKPTVPGFLEQAKQQGLGAAFKNRGRWGRMRMSPSDISDISGETYTYLINGRTTQNNWNGVFKPGERVRLRIINASAMTFFNIRIPGLPMTIVAADGINTRPHEIDEFQMGIAETYDVIIEPKEAKPYAFVAEAIDRSGQVIATLGAQPGMRATVPTLRTKPQLTMKDMGMGDMDMSGMGMDEMDMSEMDHSKMDHSQMDMSGMDGMDMDMGNTGDLKRGPGIANIAMAPTSRLHEAGIGLEDVPHRTLKYADLRSLEPNADTREPEREIELHLTSNMERYMWSFDGVTFSHVKDSIKFYQGERVRMTLINDTMMPHPIHLHGMFFHLVNGGGNHKPNKHTVIVKPGEKLSFDVSAEHVGDWAFHCHLLYHMHAGMFQVVSLLPKDESMSEMDHSRMDHSKMDHDKMEMQKPKPKKPKMNKEMDHSKMDHPQMDHSKMGEPKMNKKGMGK